jgi:hypothetical protein
VRGPGWNFSFNWVRVFSIQENRFYFKSSTKG